MYLLVECGAKLLTCSLGLSSSWTGVASNEHGVALLCDPSEKPVQSRPPAPRPGVMPSAIIVWRTLPSWRVIRIAARTPNPQKEHTLTAPPDISPVRRWPVIGGQQRGGPEGGRRDSDPICVSGAHDKMGRCAGRVQHTNNQPSAQAKLLLLAHFHFILFSFHTTLQDGRPRSDD